MYGLAGSVHVWQWYAASTLYLKVMLYGTASNCAAFFDYPETQEIDQFPLLSELITEKFANGDLGEIRE